MAKMDYEKERSRTRSYYSPPRAYRKHRCLDKCNKDKIFIHEPTDRTGESGSRATSRPRRGRRGSRDWSLRGNCGRENREKKMKSFGRLRKLFLMKKSAREGVGRTGQHW